MSREAAILPVDPTSPIARQALLAYLEDVAERYHGRPPTPAELTDAVAQRLYLSLGYRESPPHSGGPYSDRWYAKRIRSDA